MNPLDAWWADTHAHWPGARLPDTAALGVRYQPDLLDILGIALLLLPVVLLALAMAL